MSRPAASDLRADARGLAGALPPLLVAAERLAASVSPGVHGRRQAGRGEDFWQYRPALQGDEIAAVDWRRSGRSDTLYIRERERDAAHTAAIWADTSQSMAYASDLARESKAARARLLALALAMLLDKAGERTVFPGTLAAIPRNGPRQIARITQALTLPDGSPPEYGTPPDFGGVKPACTVLFSDFLGPQETLFPALAALRNEGQGHLVQILDPVEESFPFDGRVVFENMSGSLSFEARRAATLRKPYLERLAERQDMLAEFARSAGWRVLRHNTDKSARAALLVLYYAMDDAR